jgi:hypothetical protein
MKRRTMRSSRMTKKAVSMKKMRKREKEQCIMIKLCIKMISKRRWILSECNSIGTAEAVLKYN